MFDATIKLNDSKEREFTLSKQEFSFIAKLAYDRTGIVLSENKHDMVYGRLVRRLRALDLPGFKEYCGLLESPEGKDEVIQLVNALTTNLTRFFRESHHFDHLNEWLSELSRNKPSKIRLWSAACSSGMEPYSMSMVMKHALNGSPGCDAKILATDIDQNMLNTGRAGIYKQGDVEEVPAQYKKMMTSINGEQVKMHDDIKKLIAFKSLNLLEAWPMKGKFDAIFCRNVVIYFDKPTKDALFNRMAKVLNPGGYLYIGHSENMQDITCFKSVGRTVYQKVDD